MAGLSRRQSNYAGDHLSREVKVAFASCLRDHVPGFLDKFAEIAPESDLWVVSEFQPPRGRWIPYRIDRSAAENLTAFRSALADRSIRFVALSLQPKTPYGPMRRMALKVAPLRTLFYNENLDHFTLRPRSWPAVLQYLAWKTREQITWQIHPGGDFYTFAWRLKHPGAFRRPLAYIAAKKTGQRIAAHKRGIALISSQAPESNLPDGTSVIIPTRNGRELLTELLPLLAICLMANKRKSSLSTMGQPTVPLTSLRSSIRQFSPKSILSP